MSEEGLGQTAPEAVAAPQSCREMMIALGKGYDPKLTSEQQAMCARLGRIMQRHPRVGHRLEDIILMAYEHDTGVDVHLAAVDWQAVIAWLVANMPKILEILLSLLALFGL